MAELVALKEFSKQFLEIKNRLDYIRNKFPARGEIQGTMSASGYRYTSTLIYE